MGHGLVKKESFTVSSVCAKSCVKNTKKGIFKIQGRSKAKTCAKWASKKKCNSLVKKKDYTVSSVCGKSCDHCAAAPTAAPSAAPTVTWKPSSTFAPSATFAPSSTFAPSTAAPSAAPSAVPSLAPTTCTNTKKGTFKIEGNSKAKTCAKWAKKGKCNKQMKDGGGQVFTVCRKSCVTNTPPKKKVIQFLRCVVSHVTIAHHWQHRQRHRPKRGNRVQRSHRVRRSHRLRRGNQLSHRPPTKDAKSPENKKRNLPQRKTNTHTHIYNTVIIE